MASFTRVRAFGTALYCSPEYFRVSGLGFAKQACKYSGPT